ncbi:CARDB domain-containing protein [Halovenus marina]|uniref:CARDB domain-containing protein n=1 Tax=Halovenus marina TaxID=3396621 RepID=UPI003F563633
MDTLPQFTTVVLIGSLLLLAGLSFAGPALALSTETVQEADRTAESETLAPGESTQVTVNVTLENTGGLLINETFDSAFETVEIVDNGGADFDGVNNANTQLFAEWASVQETTLVYEVTIPEDAQDGETFTIESGSDSDVTLAPTTLTVDKDLPNFQLSNLQPGDTEVDPGQTVDVSATVTNTGEATDEQNISLQIESETVASTSVSLTPGETQDITFTDVSVPETTGSHQYSVSSENDAVTATFTVADGSDQTDRTVQATELPPGETTVVSVDVTLDQTDSLFIAEQFDPAFEAVEIVDDGGADFSGVNNANTELFAEWSAVQDTSVVYEVTLPQDAPVGTEYNLSSGPDSDVDLGTDTIVVADGEPAAFNLTEFDPPASAAQGDIVDANVTVTNVGDLSGQQTIEFALDSETIATRSLSLAGGATETISFELDTTDLDPGTYNQTVSTSDDTEFAELEVTHSVVTYADEKGAVGIGGLSQAIDDWRAGEIGLDLLREVIDGWRSN